MSFDGRFFVYFLASGFNGILYIGVTNDLHRRLSEHRAGDASRFTSRYNVTRLVHVERYATALEAIAREKQLKRWRREWKLALFEEHNPDWHDLSEELLF